MEWRVTLSQDGGAGDVKQMQDMQQRLSDAEGLAASSSAELLGLQVTRDCIVISFAPLLTLISPPYTSLPSLHFTPLLPPSAGYGRRSRKYHIAKVAAGTLSHST